MCVCVCVCLSVSVSPPLSLSPPLSPAVLLFRTPPTTTTTPVGFCKLHLNTACLWNHLSFTRTWSRPVNLPSWVRHVCERPDTPPHTHTQPLLCCFSPGKALKLTLALFTLLHVCHVIAAYMDDIVVGAVCCRVDEGKPDSQLYIMTLGCLAPYRRLGLGLWKRDSLRDTKAKQSGNACICCVVMCCVML